MSIWVTTGMPDQLRTSKLQPMNLLVPEGAILRVQLPAQRLLLEEHLLQVPRILRDDPLVRPIALAQLVPFDLLLTDLELVLDPCDPSSEHTRISLHVQLTARVDQVRFECLTTAAELTPQLARKQQRVS